MTNTLIAMMLFLIIILFESSLCSQRLPPPECHEEVGGKKCSDGETFYYWNGAKCTLSIQNCHMKKNAFKNFEKCRIKCDKFYQPGNEEELPQSCQWIIRDQTPELTLFRIKLRRRRPPRYKYLKKYRRCRVVENSWIFENSFESKEKCLETCIRKKKDRELTTQKECNVKYPNESSRFYWKSKKGKGCRKITCIGCKDTDYFKNKKECKKKCSKNPSNCSTRIKNKSIRFTWNVEKKKCKKFRCVGCTKNHYFTTREKCINSCKENTVG